MGDFTNTYQDVRNLTCRPRDNLTFKRELERQCHMQMHILLFAAFAFGCLLIISVRAIISSGVLQEEEGFSGPYLKEGQTEVTITLLP